MSFLKKTVAIFIILILTFILLEVFYRASLKYISYFKYKNIQNYYNLCLVGGSTAAGVPFNNDITIGKLVSYSFNDSINEKPINVINLGAAGMPINTAFWATRELVLGLDSGTMLLYTGINDSYLQNETKSAFFLKLMSHSWVLSRVSYRLYPWDTSEQKFKFYYEEILKMLQKDGWTIISSTLVGNYREYCPDVQSQDFIDDDKSKLKQVSINQLSNSNIGLISNSPFKLYLNAHLLKNKNTDSAQFYFQEAVNIDYGHSRPPIFKNKLIEQINLKYGVQCVKPMPKFIEKSNGLFPGYNLFMDAHHPNLTGYIILSNLFAAELAKHHKISFNNLKEDNVQKHFNLNSRFYDKAYLTTIEWHMLECLYSSYYFDRLEKSIEYLGKVKRKTKKYRYWKMVSLVFDEDYLEFESYYEKNKNNIDFSFTLLDVDEYNRVSNSLGKGIELGYLSEEMVEEFLTRMN